MDGLGKVGRGDLLVMALGIGRSDRDLETPGPSSKRTEVVDEGDWTGVACMWRNARVVVAEERGLPGGVCACAGDQPVLRCRQPHRHHACRVGSKAADHPKS